MKVGLHGRRERLLRKPIKRRRIKMQFQVRRGRKGGGERELQANLVPAPPHIKTWYMVDGMERLESRENAWKRPYFTPGAKKKTANDNENGRKCTVSITPLLRLSFPSLELLLKKSSDRDGVDDGRHII